MTMMTIDNYDDDDDNDDDNNGDDGGGSGIPSVAGEAPTDDDCLSKAYSPAKQVMMMKMMMI